MYNAAERNRRNAGREHPGVRGIEKPAVARSAFMCSEEIDEERARSGWNPYAGEEEALPDPAGQAAPAEDDGAGPDCAAESGDPDVLQMQPYFTMPEYTQILEEQREMERDMRKLQSMYPEAAKLMLPHVEEECDKMEYEGSPMFDEYPDQTTVYRLSGRIYEQVSGQFPEEAQEPDDVLSMQYRGPDRNRPGRNWARDLARVLLLQEMYHRRCRHRECRKHRF